LRAACYPWQDLPCFKSQVDDTFTTTNQAFYKDTVVVKELMNPQVIYAVVHSSHSVRRFQSRPVAQSAPHRLPPNSEALYPCLPSPTVDSHHLFQAPKAPLCASVNFVNEPGMKSIPRASGYTQIYILHAHVHVKFCVSSCCTPRRTQSYYFKSCQCAATQPGFNRIPGFDVQEELILTSFFIMAGGLPHPSRRGVNLK
jgi:hypothetical protein